MNFYDVLFARKGAGGFSAGLSKYVYELTPTWTDGKYINTSGEVETATNYSVSSPIKIRKGQRIVFSATGSSSTSILTKYDKDGNATMIFDGSANPPMRFIIPKKFWIADEDCTLIISHKITKSSQDETNILIPNDEVKPTIYNDEIFLSGSNLWKKKMVVCGDSLVYGSRIGNYPTWCTWIAAKYRMTLVNAGINGSSIAELTPEQITANGGDEHDPIVNRYNALLQANKDADIIVYEGGANDRTQNVPLGDVTSTTKTEFCGAINRIINGTRIICPKAKVFFISIPWRWTELNSLNLNEADYAEAMTAVCAAKSIPCRNPCFEGDIDFRNSYIASWADEGLWPNVLPTPAANRHYSPEAYQWIIPRIEKFIDQ